MKAYLYDENNLFITVYKCQESPLEPGHFIAPTASTFTEAVLINGYWPVYNPVNNNWFQEEDNRGPIYDLVTGDQSELTVLGPVPDGFTKLPHEAPPKPDLKGFYDTIKASFGGIKHLNQFARQYPLLISALNEQDWSDLTDLVTDALSSTVINQNQYNKIQDAFTINHIPITLP
jgi:hypothetical protein